MSADWLKQRRDELRLTQDELAARLQLAGLDVSRSAVSHWEKGRDNPPLSDVNARRAIADALDLTVGELLLLAGYSMEDEQATPGEAARRAALIVDKLPPAVQKAALDQLRALERLAAGI